MSNAPTSPNEYGGAGWVRSPTQQQFGDTPAPAQRRGGRDIENSTLVPRTIKQLLNATQTVPDEAFKIDGRDVTTVSILGLILEATVESTHYNYKVDDGTGCIDVRVWISDSLADPARQAQLREGVYVRVTGNLRSFMDQKNIMAWQMVPVTDFNEITWHGLSVIHAHLYNTRGPLPSSTPPAATATTSGAVPPQQPAQAAPAATAGRAAPPPPAAPPMGAGEVPMTPCQQQVLNVLQSPQGGEGITIDDVVKTLEGTYTEAEVKDAVELLFAQGRLCSTHDEEHYTANT